LVNPRTVDAKTNSIFLLEYFNKLKTFFVSDGIFNVQINAFA